MTGLCRKMASGTRAMREFTVSATNRVPSGLRRDTGGADDQSRRVGAHGYPVRDHRVLAVTRGFSRLVQREPDDIALAGDRPSSPLVMPFSTLETNRSATEPQVEQDGIPWSVDSVATDDFPYVAGGVQHE